MDNQERNRILDMAILGLPTTLPDLIKAYLDLGADKKRLLSSLEEAVRNLKAEPKLSNEVLWFAAEMEKKLNRNRWKGHWEAASDEYLMKRAREELVEVQDELNRSNPGMFHPKVVEEAADVANFMLMLADNHRR
jgi:NTP pyrophosphatase (non-canonical NTP hydrolase)